MFKVSKLALATSLVSVVATGSLFADEHHAKGIHAQEDTAVKATFDIYHTKITTEGNNAIFHMAVTGKAGATVPTKSGALAGSSVYSYVWPTSLDPSVVGFESNSGILSFAVTSHPDFDDTPLFDENGDGDLTNDGNIWHSHWVVLQPAPDCGVGMLKVVDIPEGVKPALPKTWPGLPILIDSPGWSPSFNEGVVEVRVPFEDISAVTNTTFDGVTATLRVNESVHSPLLCVVNVFKVASGDLSLSGKVNQ